ncbi:Copia protein, partial [Stegodyphus mimosarum]
MTDPLNDFFILVDKLKEMEINTADDLLTILLLYSIPDSYESFRIAIESRDEFPAPEMLKIKLLEGANARKNKNSSYCESQRAFYSKDRKYNQRPVPKPKLETSANRKYPVNYRCNFCNIYGHRASECRKKNKENKSKRLGEIAMSAENQNSVKQERAASCTDSDSKDIFCLDSGATSHMCNSKELFQEIHEVGDIYVKLAANKIVKAIGKGTVKFKVRIGSKTESIKLENVLCVPDLKNNLISVSKVTANNYSVIFKGKCARIINSNNETVISAKRENYLYYVMPIFESLSIAKEIDQWHTRFGHLNENDFKKFCLNNMVRGLSFSQNDSLSTCKFENCSSYDSEQEISLPFAPEEKIINKLCRDKSSPLNGKVSPTDSENESESDLDSESVSPILIKRGLGRPKKIKTGLSGRPKKEYQYTVVNKNEQLQNVVEEIINPTVQEALNGPYAENWRNAMLSEYNSLVQENAWKLVKRPENKKVISSRCVTTSTAHRERALYKPSSFLCNILVSSNKSVVRSGRVKFF